ncbi:MAG: metallophosphoesterase family protein [Clostridia bacterium]|nr:metallophosphoesterase family protein [Clostridia bacterium]
MTYAIISDIHGNAPSLQLVLADARAHGADGYLFAGDYCISAPWANEVIGLIRSIPGARCIRGNDEDHLDAPDGDDGQFEVSRWCARAISPDNRAWLDALPEEIALDCQGVTIRMAHSSEAFVGKTLHEHFRTSALPARYPEGAVSREALLDDFRHTLAQDERFCACLATLQQGIYIFGHNHIQSHGCFDGRWLINPGSCGLPLDCGDFCAAYTLLTIEDGVISVEERRIPYDVEALIAQVKTTGQYQNARIWSEVIFSEWHTCREKVYFFLTCADEYARRTGDERRPFARDTWEAAYAAWQDCAGQRWPELFVR